MSRKPQCFTQVINVLTSLHRSYPTYNIGRHLSTALDGYGDFWGMTDRELLFALEKYKTQLEMDVPHIDDQEIDDIIKDGMNLENILKEEDNGEDY
jgi:hypothetical protein